MSANTQEAVREELPSIFGNSLGLYERYEMDLEVRESGKHWREDAFLHQLSNNGSMMLAVNHDRLWRECLASTLGQPLSMDWQWLRGLLLVMPASAARTRLWRASYLWWVHTQRLRLRVLSQALESGYYSYLRAAASSRALETELTLRGRQLNDLAWCLQPPTSTDEGVIEVIEGKPSPKRRK